MSCAVSPFDDVSVVHWSNSPASHCVQANRRIEGLAPFCSCPMAPFLFLSYRPNNRTLPVNYPRGANVDIRTLQWVDKSHSPYDSGRQRTRFERFGIAKRLRVVKGCPNPSLPVRSIQDFRRILLEVRTIGASTEIRDRDGDWRVYRLARDV